MKLSNCCGAPLYEETDICTCCGEHCEIEEEPDYRDPDYIENQKWLWADIDRKM